MESQQQKLELNNIQNQENQIQNENFIGFATKKLSDDSNQKSDNFNNENLSQKINQEQGVDRVFQDYIEKQENQQKNEDQQIQQENSVQEQMQNDLKKSQNVKNHLFFSIVNDDERNDFQDQDLSQTQKQQYYKNEQDEGNQSAGSYEKIMNYKERNRKSSHDSSMEIEAKQNIQQQEKVQQKQQTYEIQENQNKSDSFQNQQSGIENEKKLDSQELQQNLEKIENDWKNGQKQYEQEYKRQTEQIEQDNELCKKQKDQKLMEKLQEQEQIEQEQLLKEKQQLMQEAKIKSSLKRSYQNMISNKNSVGKIVQNGQGSQNQSQSNNNNLSKNVTPNRAKNSTSNQLTPIRNKNSISKISNNVTPLRNKQNMFKSGNNSRLVSQLKEKSTLFQQEFSQGYQFETQRDLFMNKEMSWEQKIEKSQSDLGIGKISEHEIKIIKNICQNKNQVAEFFKNNESLYQILGYLLPNLVIVIGHSQMHLQEKMKSVKNILPWGCINNLLNQDQKNKVLELVSNNSIKLLFCSPELFFSDSYLFIPMTSCLIFEEGLAINDYGTNLKCFNPLEVIFNKVQPEQVTFLSNFTTQENLKQLGSLIQIEEHEILRVNDSQIEKMINFNNISFSRDDDKLKALYNFLRNPKLVNKNGKNQILIYCDNKKQCEEVTNKLNLNGFKAQNQNNLRSENQKFELQSNLIKNGNYDILVYYGNQGILKQVKEQVQVTILYSIPRSIEQFMDIVQFLSNSCLIHGFIHEEDYNDIRADMASDFFTFAQFQIILYKLFKKCQSKENVLQDNYMVNSVIEQQFLNLPNDEQNLEKFLEQDQNEQSEKKYEESENCDQTLKIHQICNELELKRENFQEFINQLQKDNLIEVYNSMIVELNVRILPNQNLQNQRQLSNSTLSNSEVMKYINENCKSNQGIYKVQVLEMGNELGMSVSEILKEMKKYVHEKKIWFEVCEEVLGVKTLQQIQKNEIFDYAVKFYKYLVLKQNLKITNFDIVTLALKQSSYNTVDQVFKYKKYQNIKITDKNKMFSNVPRLSGMQKSEKSQVYNLKSFIIDKYLKMDSLDQVQNYLQLFKQYGINGLESLPFLKLNSQREKSGVQKDIQKILEKQLDQTFMEELDNQQELQIEVRSKEIVMVLQGLNHKYSVCSEWKASPLWKKYYKFDYNQLMEITQQYLMNYNNNLSYNKVGFVEPAIKKKVKVNN